MGKIGIEQSYEQDLHGITGFEEMETDAAGRVIRVISRTPPVSGNNLTLSLDAKLQEVAEKAFGDRRGRWWRSNLHQAMFSPLFGKPGFDPNLFVDGIDSENWDLLNNSIDQPLNNRALLGLYPPGSTFKTVYGAGWAGAENVRLRMPLSILGTSVSRVARTASGTGRLVVTVSWICTSRS